MIIDWQNFTLIASLLGGLLIGIAAALLILFNGKIAGISGIIGGLISANRDDRFWRIAFLVGLIIAPSVWQIFYPLPTIQISSNTPLVIIAGLLVGIGTRIGSGCTSGHGVCGISRFSTRSIIATLMFMAVGFITVFLVRHVFSALI
jgi:uncharacterized membrane protein YedE/YeeE